MTNERIELYTGEIVGTGLWVPDVKPTAFALFCDSVPMLTHEQVLRLINDPQRRMGRKRFDSSWIGNQGGFGSCNGYAGAKALQRSRVMGGRSRVDLSGEGLYAQINDGRDQGSGLQEGMECLCENGVPPESMIPPRSTYRWDKINQEAKDARSRFKADECYRAESDEELAVGVALGFMAVVAVQANDSFQNLDDNGIASDTDGPGNHAVGVDDVRFFAGEYQYDFYNSWGLNYGDKGRAFLSWRRHFGGPSRNHAFYLIRTANDDPQGDNPPRVIL